MSEEKEYEYMGVNVPPLLKKAIDTHVNKSQASMGEYVREAIREKLERDYGINASNLNELRKLIDQMEKKDPSTLKDCHWGDLNENEKKALDFLLEEGHGNLERGGKGEPDFYNGRDEFEVKVPQPSGRIEFTSRQVPHFEEADPYIIIVYDDEVADMVRYSQLGQSGGDRHSKYWKPLAERGDEEMIAECPHPDCDFSNEYSSRHGAMVGLKEHIRIHSESYHELAKKVERNLGNG